MRLSAEFPKVPVGADVKRIAGDGRGTEYGFVEFDGGDHLAFLAGEVDDLAQALGSPEPLPALGFAYTLESLLEAVEHSGAADDGASEASGALVIADSPKSYRAALRAASDLRQQGIQTELDVRGRDLGEGLVYARKSGMAQVVVVSVDGQRTAHSAEPDRR